MARAIEQLRDYMAQGNYKARQQLWQAEFNTQSGTLQEVQEFIAVATELQSHLDGEGREECARHIANAELRVPDLVRREQIYGDAVAFLRGCAVLGAAAFPCEWASAWTFCSRDQRSMS